MDEDERMKVILYQPDIPERLAYHPLHLMVLATSLEKAGHEPIIVDKRIGQTPPNDYDIVGVSAMTGEPILDAIKFCKSVHGPKIWGGWHPTLAPEETAKHPEVDIVVRGQGEQTLTEIADQKPLDQILGITYKKEGKIVSNPDRPRVPMDGQPRPAWHLVDMKRYVEHTKLGDTQLPYLASEGCPYRCGYCCIGHLKHKWSGLNPEIVAKELTMLKEKYGINSIYMMDNLFFVNKRWTAQVLEKIKPLELKWNTSTRANIINRMTDQEIKDAIDSGCTRIAIGAESGSDAVLQRIKKDVTARETRKAIDRLTKAGMQVATHYMFGLPGETLEDAKQTLTFIRGLLLNTKVTMFGIYYYMPCPGTDLFTEMLTEGYQPPRGLEEWGKVGWTQIPKNLDPRIAKKIEFLKRMLSYRKPGKLLYVTLGKMGLT